MRPKLRRGGTLALVLGLYLSLAAVLLGAVSVASISSSAAEREYCRSQALALAEAAVEEARSGAAPHGFQPLGPGRYSWSEDRIEGERLIVARGEVASASGAVVSRTVRALLAPAASGWRIAAWEEGP